MTKTERHLKYQAHINGQPIPQFERKTAPVALPVDRSGPCRFRSEEPTGQVHCPTCAGGVRLKTFDCQVHGTCTIQKPAPGVPGCCARCNQYETGVRSELPTYNPVEKRHLVFHVLPVSGNGVWRRAIRHLTLRWSLFTGRKIISVATSAYPVRERIDRIERVPSGIRTLTVDPVSAVRAALPPDAEVVEVPNDPHGWERASWNRAWGEVLSTAGPDDAVFYAHAKGVTRKITSVCHAWAELLYAVNLDYWSAVGDELTRKPVCGSLVKWGRFFGGALSESRWHYSGNFWWGRTGILSRRMPAHPLQPDPWAAEAWVGWAFSPVEAGVVFQPESPFDHIYKPDCCERILTDYDRWCLSHPADVSVSPVSGSRR